MECNVVNLVRIIFDQSDPTMNKFCIALRNWFHCTSPDIRGIAIDGVGMTKEVAGLLRSVGFLGP
jgi:hypothetical protein